MFENLPLTTRRVKTYQTSLTRISKWQGQNSGGDGGSEGKTVGGSVAAQGQASDGREGQCQTGGGSDAGQGQTSGGDSGSEGKTGGGSDARQCGSDGECQASNRFELMQPMPKKVFSEKKANAKSRATTSRVLTEEKHLSSLQEELRLFEIASKVNKRKQGTQNTKCKPVLKPEKVMTNKM